MANSDSFLDALNKRRKSAGLETTDELAKKAPASKDTTLEDLGKIFQNLWGGTKNAVRGIKITNTSPDTQLAKFAYKDQLNALNDAAKSPWAKTWDSDTINVWSGMHGGIYQARRDKEETAKNKIEALSQQIADEQKHLQELNEGSSAFTRVLSDMAYNTGTMLPALPLGTPGVALQGASNYGMNLADEINAGTELEEAKRRAGARATAETAIEYLSGGLAGTAAKSGLMKPVTKVIDNAVTSSAGRKALTRLAASVGEGAEEALTTAVMPYVDRLYLGVDTPNASVGDLAKSFGMGAGTSLVIGGGQDAINAARNKRGITKIADQTGRTKEEVKNSLKNFNTVEARDVAKALDPADFEPKLATAENMQRYAKEIDDVFTGKAKDGAFVELGETPAILQRLGAKSRKLTMTQDTARKIAYPAGYKIGGKSMGGKHNLGIPALKKLPEQLENPMAVLKSKTQPNSFVVLTNWKLDDGSTVITPIHLDKQGRVTIDNRVVSTYSRDIQGLLGENNENVLWRKNDRSINQLLGERLQLPMASSDDASSIYNMPQGKNYVNAQIANNTEVEYNKLKGGRNDEASIDLRSREIYGRGMDGGLNSAVYRENGRPQGSREAGQAIAFGTSKRIRQENNAEARMGQSRNGIHKLGFVTEVEYNKLKGGRNDEASIDLRSREIYGRGMDGGLDSAAYADEGQQGRKGDSQESIYGASKPGNAELYGHIRMEQDGSRIHGLGSITTEDPVIHQALIQNNATAFPMRSDVSGIAFFDAISNAKKENKHGAYVTAYEPEDYDGFRTLFLDESGLSGIGVKQDGDIVSVFKSEKSPYKKATSNLLLNALDVGGNKLDNFDGALSNFYADHGFIPVARVAFDRNYAPENWNYELFGEPDVIFWIHNGDSPQAVAQKIGDYQRYDTSKLPLFNSYEEAAAYRDSLLNSPDGPNGKGTPNSSTMSENQQTNPTGENMGERRTTKRILNDESTLVFDDPQKQAEFYDEINNAKNVYYEKVSTKEATEKALNEIEQRGIDGAANLFYKNLGTVKRGKERAENLILGVELAKAYTETGNVDGASNIISEIMPITTDAAQVMSLTKALYKLGGRGVLKGIQSDLDRINKQRGTDIQIDQMLADKLIAAKTEPEIEAAAQAIEADLKLRIPVKLHEKLAALRRISMLANPKTQVRNVVGNAAMNLMGRLSSSIDGVLQRTFIRNPDERTNTVFKRRSPEYSNARMFAKEYFGANKEQIGGDSRYDSRISRLLKDRDTYKNKALRFLETKTNRVMEVGDEFFVGDSFQRHFANEVAARKLSMDDLKNPENKNKLQEIINRASLKAQKETFRDESVLANRISAEKNKLNNSKNPLARAAGAWMDGVIPFVKTPINVTKRAIDYSPLGVIKSVYNGIRSKGTPMAKANFINNLSQNLTGTIVMGLGYVMAQSGLIRIGEDDKEEYYQGDQGHQRYSLEIGDTSISLDWLAPASVPFFAGAALSQTDGADSIDDAFAAGQQIFGPLMEMSMMSSADDMLTNIRKADTNIDAIAEAILYTPFESYLLQYLPTFGSQLNQVIDPTRRTTYTNSESGVLSRLEKTGRKALNKLPGANLLLENMGLENVANAPYVNAWGEKEVDSGNVLERVFNSFVNPAYVNQISSDPVDREIERLYNSNVEDSKNIIPTTSFGTVTNGGREYKMTTTEVTKHRQTQGQMSKQILQSLMNSSDYRMASDEDKVSMIKDVYKYAQYKADSEMLDGRGRTYVIKDNDWRKKVDYLDVAGVSPTTYFLAHNARSNAEGEYRYNEWGELEAVSGTKKRAEVDSISGMGMTAAQKLLFLYLEHPSYSYGREYSGMSNSQARRVVATYVLGLNISHDEKINILKRAGYHIGNDGYVYWD